MSIELGVRLVEPGTRCQRCGEELDIDEEGPSRYMTENHRHDTLRECEIAQHKTLIAMLWKQVAE